MPSKERYRYVLKGVEGCFSSTYPVIMKKLCFKNSRNWILNNYSFIHNVDKFSIPNMLAIAHFKSKICTFFEDDRAMWISNKKLLGRSSPNTYIQLIVFTPKLAFNFFSMPRRSRFFLKVAQGRYTSLKVRPTLRNRPTYFHTHCVTQNSVICQSNLSRK